MRLILRLIAVSLSLIALAGVRWGYSSEGDRKTSKRLAVYLYFNAADPNLQDDIVPTIDGMESAFSRLSKSEREQVAFLVQVDAPRHPAAGRYRIAPDARTGRFSSLVSAGQDYGKHEPDPSASLESFLAWAENEAPAASRVLILGGHGTAAGATLLGGKQTMNIGQGVSVVSLAITLSKYAPYDAIAFENCLTQTVEILYELKDAAKYLVGSEEVLTAFDYEALTGKLVASRGAKGVADAFIGAYQKDGGRKSKGYTLSAVKSDGVPAVAAAVKAWADQAYKDCHALIAAHRHARYFAKPKVYDGIADQESKDLGDMMARFSGAAAVGHKEAKAVLAAVDGAVTNRAFKKNGTGIAIYLPAKVEPSEIQALRYTRLRFVREGGGMSWLRFLRSLNLAQNTPGLEKTAGIGPGSGKELIAGPPEEEAKDACPTSLTAILKRLEGQPYAAGPGDDAATPPPF